MTTNDKVYIESPIEGIFDIEPGTTLSNIQVTAREPVATENEKDADDVVVDSQLATVYDYAIEAFEAQSEQIQTIDPKFAARNAEVAAQYLKIALDATTGKAKIKLEREKNLPINNKPGVVTNNNNIIVADRNAILRELMSFNNNAE